MYWVVNSGPESVVALLACLTLPSSLACRRSWHHGIMACICSNEAMPVRMGVSRKSTARSLEWHAIALIFSLYFTSRRLLPLCLFVAVRLSTRTILRRAGGKRREKGKKRVGGLIRLFASLGDGPLPTPVSPGTYGLVVASAVPAGAYPSAAAHPARRGGAPRGLVPVRRAEHRRVYAEYWHDYPVVRNDVLLDRVILARECAGYRTSVFWWWLLLQELPKDILSRFRHELPRVQRGGWRCYCFVGQWTEDNLGIRTDIQEFRQTIRAPSLQHKHKLYEVLASCRKGLSLARLLYRDEYILQYRFINEWLRQTALRVALL